jgi:opacity protein-like surface antigen
MKRFSLVLSAFVMLVGFGATTAGAQMYVSGNIGAVVVSDADVSFEGITFGEFSFDTGFGITGGIGHAYGNNLRSEVELSYRTNDLDTIKFTGPFAGFGSLPLNGDVSALSLMLNGYYDFTTAGVLTPFIGAGLGFSRVSVDSGTLEVDDSDTVFAYQLALGGSFTINPQLNLVVQYRFFGTSDPSFTDNDGDRFKTEYMTHNFLAGLRYSF